MPALQVVALLGGVVGMLTAIISSTACFYNLHTTSKNSLLILERKVKELKYLLQDIQQKLNEKGVLRLDLSNRIQITNDISVPRRNLSEWIDEANTCIKERDEMNLGIRLNKSCAHYMPNVCSLCGTWKLIEEKVGKINELLLEGQEFKFIGYKKSSDRRKIFGKEIETMREDIWKEVSQEAGGLQVVCIHGMAGVGKTVMASAIHDKALEQLTYLENVIWVGIKHKSSIKDIQEEIARQLPVDISHCNDDKSRAITLEGALSEKKFFMVLDNLPMRQDFHIGDIGIPRSGHDWKLVVASRSHSACTKVKGIFTEIRSKIYEMQPLSEQEAWGFFFEVARPNSVYLKSDVCEDTKRAIHDLEGLPAAVKMLAKALKQITDDHPDRINSAWHRELVALSSSGSLLGNKSEKFVSRIKSSFENLTEYHLSCLLYSLLLPKGYQIKAKELIEYWVCEGLLDKEVTSLEKATVMGWEVITKLSDVHLFRYDDKEEFVMMLNTVRLVAMDVAKSRNEIFFVNCDESLKELPVAKDWPEKVLRASFVENKVRALQNGPDCKELSTLLLQKNHLDLKPHRRFFSKLFNLRVLDLSHTKITSLPSSLFSLKELRALLLRNCYNLTSLQSLSEMQNLLVIDLSGTPLANVPYGLKDLTKLRRLDLSQTKIEVFRAEEINKLTRIEELLLITNQDEGKLTWGSNNMSSAWIGPCIEEFVDLTKLVALQLKFLNTNVFKRFLETSKFAKSGQRCKFCVGGSYNKGGRVIGDNSLTIMEDRQSVTLPSLESYGCFSNLTTIDVSKFEKLKYVLTWETANNLNNLRNIHVKLCKKVKSIIKSRAKGENDVVKLPALTTLVLYGLPKLESICGSQELNCSSMQEIEVWSCGSLKLPQTLNGAKNGVEIKGDQDWIDKVKRNHCSTSTSTFKYSVIALPIELSLTPGWRSDVVASGSSDNAVPSEPRPEPPNGSTGITTMVTSLAGRIYDPIRHMYVGISTRFADEHHSGPITNTEDEEFRNALRRSNSH